MQTIFHFQAAEENYKSLIHCTFTDYRKRLLLLEYGGSTVFTALIVSKAQPLSR